MHPFITFVVLNFLLHLPFSFGADDYRYTNCSQPINCGNFTNIPFPFWGIDRPEYCGLPGYELRCEDDERVELVTGPPNYRVLNFSEVDQRLHIVPVDTLNDSCLAPSVNVSFPVPTGIFTYSLPNTVNITLFYDCPPIPWLAAYAYPCSPNDTAPTTNYFWIGPFNRIAPGEVAAVSGCNDIVSVPILQTFADSRDQSRSQQVLREGFEVGYIANSTFCRSCQDSDGRCGYNWTTTLPVCFCYDNEYEGRCPPRPVTRRNNVRLKVIIGVCAGVGCVILTCIGFFLHLRRKKNRFSKKSSNLISRDISDHSLKPDIENGSIYFQTPIFTYKELDEATNHFDTNKEVGDGGFGTVYHGKLRDGRIVAVKRLFEHNYKRVEQFINEIAILSRLRHQNLVSLYGCTSQHSRELLLVYEYVPNGTVADHIHGERAKAGLLTWPIRMSIAIESADALAYLHASDIIHRDVKTNNILLDNGFHVKVADFGLSRLFPTDVSHVSTAPQGTPGYVDPEYYQCYQLNDKSDVYSFGVVLIELISSKTAVDIGRHRHEVNLASLAINKIHNQALHELVDPSLGFETDYNTRNMITSMAELAFRCLQQEKEMRPCMVEVVEVLRGIESEDYRKKTDEMDVSADISLLKNIEPLSPVSVTDIWASKSTTPNTSAGGNIFSETRTTKGDEGSVKMEGTCCRDEQWKGDEGSMEEEEDELLTGIERKQDEDEA